jgi:glycosyltransferase involved in cell wall biosynthesis
VSAFSVDGINFFIWELAEGLIRQGHEVYVVSGGDANREKIKEMFEVSQVPIVVTLSKGMNLIQRNRLILSWFWRGSRVLSDIAPDLLICNGAVPLCNRTLKFCVCHDLEFRESFQKKYAVLIYRSFDKTVATSTELTQNAPYELKLRSSKVTRIPVCVGVQKYIALAYDKREHALLHVGTWIDKNLSTTVNAFRMIAQSDAQIKLYIVGNLWGLAKAILSQVEERISERIVCLGNISKKELKALYSRVKVTCVPSLYRVPVLSPTVLESLATGTPVIGSSSGISRDILIDGYNGFRVDSQDSISMAQKISILTTNPELWKKMSKNALTLVKSFDTPVVANKYIQLYERCMSR